MCIASAVCLVMAIFSMADMGIRSQKSYFLKTNGNYHISLTEVNEDITDLVGTRVDVAVSGWVYQGITGFLNNKVVSFVGANYKSFKVLTEMNLLSGSYPEKDNEALLNESGMKELGVSVGDTVNLTIPSGEEKPYVITGVLQDLSSILKADAYGVALSESGFRAIADSDAVDGSTYRVQFKKGVSVQKAMANIQKQYNLKNSQIAENTVLLGLIGQSKNSMMQSLYIVAGVLVLLVLLAGTIMISASFNINVSERTKFFGVLRCLGASKSQIKRFVVLQGLRQSMYGVPIGLLLGQCITWGACFLLRKISSRLFSEIPMFQFSIVGIVAGVLIGFLIVLLASFSPAKKASRVSPMNAVRGATEVSNNKRHANTKLFRVETAMGIYHAVSGTRNILLMTCSFAVSIILFLSFQVLVIFLNQGMPALEKSAPDLVLIQNEIPFSSSFSDDLKNIVGVKQVYRRNEKTRVKISTANSSGDATVVSYDDTQFNWAESKLIEGNINSVKTGENSVLVSYQEKMNWKVGDKISIETENGSKSVKIAGILSKTFASSKAGKCGYIICSEKTYAQLEGNANYNVVNIKLSRDANNKTITDIQYTDKFGSHFYDNRLSNKEVQSSFYTGAIFIYGFLIIIALITVFNIFNSMNASVSSRLKQYGVMRSIGISVKQLQKMVAAESVTYALLGCIAGCILGLPLNKLLFQYLITNKWGTLWAVPIKSFIAITVLCLLSSVTAIFRPIKKLNRMTIVDSIRIEQ